MLLKSLNDALGPKVITSEGNTQEIGKLVKNLTSKEFQEVKRERQVRVRSKRDPIVPQRMRFGDNKPCFHSNKYMFRKQEEQTNNFDLALSKLDPGRIKHIKDEHKASQKVYERYYPETIEKKPPTRLERNMMMFKEIFIQPEIQRIEGLKSKEKEFTHLVHNVINDQYDKLLEVQFKKIQNQQGRAQTNRPLTAMANVSYAKTNSLSKNIE